MQVIEKRSVRTMVFYAATTLVLSASVPSAISAQGGTLVAQRAPGPVVARTPIAPVRAFSPAYTRPSPMLTARIDELHRNFPGKAGIAVRRIDGAWAYSKRGNDLFPQQSVSKLWVSMAALDQVDRGLLKMETPVSIGPENLTLFHQPIAARVAREGRVHETVSSLMELAITGSDNTANDALLWKAGGPNAVRDFITKRQLGAIRFGPGERLLQAGIAGMNWNQAYSEGRRFYLERSKVPEFIRKKALDSYVANPIDGAAPLAIVDALAKLARGELLSPASTRRLVATMERTKSGPRRLKGGVPPGWRVGHKTGTGQQHSAISTGYNDIAIITAPDGTRYAAAVMIGSTSVGVPARMALMQGVSKAIADYHGL